MTPKQLRAQLVAVCHAGFKNEHQHKAWLRKHWEAISAMPDADRDAVLLAHMNATCKEFSEAPRNRLSRSPDGPDSGAGTSIPDASASEPSK